MALNQLKTLVASVTQTAADTFTQASVPTGLQAIGDIGFKLRRVTFQFPAPVEVDSAIHASLTQKSFAAIPSSSERSWIAGITRDIKLTTSGLMIYDRVGPSTMLFWDDDMDMIIATDPLYLQCGSATTSAANLLICRIDYQEVRLTETQRLAIMNNALTG